MARIKTAQQMSHRLSLLSLEKYLFRAAYLQEITQTRGEQAKAIVTGTVKLEVSSKHLVGAEKKTSFHPWLTTNYLLRTLRAPFLHKGKSMIVVSQAKSGIKNT
jgi:hypothetical protein